MSRLDDIRSRLEAVGVKEPWYYNPKHPMFLGTTHALEMGDYYSEDEEGGRYHYGRSLDLGRAGGVYARNASGVYELTEDARRGIARKKALGEFLQSCREDITYLLSLLDKQKFVEQLHDMEPKDESD